jgi:predicted metal-dependent peptidase
LRQAFIEYKPIENVHGVGGTDLSPPFESDFIREQKPELIVYSTDGHPLELTCFQTVMLNLITTTVQMAGVLPHQIRNLDYLQ